MPAPRPAYRHRRPRPVRLVSPRPAFRLTAEGLEAYMVGLDALELLREHFPAFFQEHVASVPARPEKLLGAVTAFFQLVERERGLNLRWPDDDVGSLVPCEDPVDTLHSFEWCSPEFLRDLGFFIRQVRPVYHGLGVQLFVDEEYSLDEPLQLTIHWLLEDSAFDIGLEMQMVLDCARDLSVTVEEAIARLRPLPAEVVGAELFTLVAREIPEAAHLPRPSNLLFYAVGQTGNPLADTNEYEIDALHYGDDAETWHWSDIDRLAAWQAEARAIEDAFLAWQARVRNAGVAGVEEVAEIFHRAARTLKRRNVRQEQTAKTLMGVLDAQPQLEAS